ncbi:MAG: ferritin family protein [Alphaproteobacteria bacterium]|jgi:rubrerythrin|nr:ferritin family protein [Alphaproteobacteria bacterium]MDP6565241.1 ferritin family protein [Alphaproteobacteria bacterium]MDP6813617.1 ferritin family protein [Alphaproteobacteria bacterium]
MNPPKAAIADRAELLAYAYAMENEAAERYQDLADQMFACNNDDVAELFARLAAIEAKHAKELVEVHGASPAPMAPGAYRWDSLESPENLPFAEMHYLMVPHQALQLALAAERRALLFYRDIAEQTDSDDIRALASEFAAEEAEHVRIVEEWLERYPPADNGWDEDMDPPMSH